MPASLWPWIAVAAAGALHGLNPVTGWALAAWPAQPGRKLHAARLLAPIAAGHLASVLAVAAAVPAALRFGLEFNPRVAQALAAGLLLAIVARHFRGDTHPRGRMPAGAAAIALWSFIVGLGHGAGWMLLPALASLCAGDAAAREITASGSLLLAIAAVGVHMAAMLATTAVMAALARHASRCRIASPQTMSNAEQNSR